MRACALGRAGRQAGVRARATGHVRQGVVRTRVHGATAHAPPRCGARHSARGTDTHVPCRRPAAAERPAYVYTVHEVAWPAAAAALSVTFFLFGRAARSFTCM